MIWLRNLLHSTCTVSVFVYDAVKESFERLVSYNSDLDGNLLIKGA